MLSIFTTPKPFVGHNKIIQENAIQSWKSLTPECEIILLGKDQGVAEAAEKFGCVHIPDVACNELGTPLISGLFKTAEQYARNSILCYVNGDIMFTNDLLETIPLVRKKQRFLLVGQRIDVDICEPWDFSDASWHDRLRTTAGNTGQLHSPAGIDYFIFPKGMWGNNIPDFTVGRAGWDNWMIYFARKKFISVIDGTRMITAVHQNHDYSHCSGGKQGVYTDGSEVKRNLALTNGKAHSMTIKDAVWLAADGDMKIDRSRFCFHILQLPVLFPFLARPVAVLSSIWLFCKRLLITKETGSPSV